MRPCRSTLGIGRVAGLLEEDEQGRTADRVLVVTLKFYDFEERSAASHLTRWEEDELTWRAWFASRSIVVYVVVAYYLPTT